MKKILFAITVAFIAMGVSLLADSTDTSTATTTPTFTAPSTSSFSKILILNTYDELSAYSGFNGLVFVRDAGNTRTGQHGDPTVTAGYGLYIYDPLASGSTKWRMVSKEELITKSNALDPSAYVSKDMYQRNLTSIQSQIVQFDHTVQTNTVELVALRESIADIHAAFDISTITRLREENERYHEAFSRMTNVTISVSSTFGELKTAVVDILKAADFALGGEGTYNLKE